MSLRATVTSLNVDRMLEVTRHHRDLGGSSSAFVSVNPVNSDEDLVRCGYANRDEVELKAPERLGEDLIDLQLLKTAATTRKVKTPAAPWSPEARAGVELAVARDVDGRELHGSSPLLKTRLYRTAAA